MSWLELLPAVVLRPMCVSALTTCRRLICVGPGFGIDGFGTETGCHRHIHCVFVLATLLCLAFVGFVTVLLATTTCTSETCYGVR